MQHNEHLLAFTHKVWKPPIPEATKEILKKVAPSQIYEYEDLLPSILRSPYVAVDFETQPKDPNTKNRKQGSLDFRLLEAVGVALSWVDDGVIHSCYAPFRHSLYKFNWPDPGAFLRPILENPNIIKIMHNGPFDYGVAKTEGVTTVWPFVDTQVMSWIYDENIPSGLKNLGKVYYNFPVLEFQFDKHSFGTYPPDMVSSYPCQDAYLTLLLYQFFNDNFTAAQRNLYYNLEAKISRILIEAQWRGIDIDLRLVQEYKLLLQLEREKVKKLIEDSMGVDSFGQKDISHVKMLRALKEKNVPITTTNADSLNTWLSVYAHTLDEDVRTALTNLRPFRYLNKLERTFIKQIDENLYPDGKVRPRANQWSFEDKAKKNRGTISGRFSYTKPPINVYVKQPRDEDLADFMETRLPGLALRKFFKVPNDDYVMFCGDLSQIELRIMASVANDEEMLKVFNSEGGDPYAEAASAIFNIPVQEILDGIQKYKKGDKSCALYNLMRQIGKTIVLANAYGAGKTKLALQAWKPLMQLLFDNKPPSMEKAKLEAEAFMAKSKAAFGKKNVGFSSYPKRIKDILVNHKKVTSWFGRSRRFPKYVPGDHKMELQAGNFLPQSNSIDICKSAMVYWYEKAAELQLDAWIVANIHDEIIIISSKKDAVVAGRLLAEAFEAVEQAVFGNNNPNRPRVKLDFEITIGNNWFDQKKWDFATVETASSEPTMDQNQQLPKQIQSIFDEKIKGCQKCPIFERFGYQKVFAEGKISNGVDLVIVGANPGSDEVKLQRPFVGKSGKKLREHCEAAGINLSERVLITNALWCHSPDTQGILTTHITNCKPYLDEILSIVKPKVVLCLGSIAQRAVLGGNAASLTLGWRESNLPYDVFVTYHPSYILRSPSEEADWSKMLEEVAQRLREK